MVSASHTLRDARSPFDGVAPLPILTAVLRPEWHDGHRYSERCTGVTQLLL